MIESMFPNGIWHYLAGGLAIGLGVSLIFLMTGRVAGMSTVFSSSWSYLSKLTYFAQPRFVQTRQWRLVLALGLVLGGALCLVTAAGGQTFRTEVSFWQLGLGGVIAGFGARMSNGCTSGHGICGMASLQWPSILAVLIFLATAIATAQVVRALGGM